MLLLEVKVCYKICQTGKNSFSFRSIYLYENFLHKLKLNWILRCYLLCYPLNSLDMLGVAEDLTNLTHFSYCMRVKNWLWFCKHFIFEKFRNTLVMFLWKRCDIGKVGSKRGLVEYHRAPYFLFEGLDYL